MTEKTQTTEMVVTGNKAPRNGNLAASGPKLDPATRELLEAFSKDEILDLQRVFLELSTPDSKSPVSSGPPPTTSAISGAVWDARFPTAVGRFITKKTFAQRVLGTEAPDDPDADDEEATQLTMWGTRLPAPANHPTAAGASPGFGASRSPDALLNIQHHEDKPFFLERIFASFGARHHGNRLSFFDFVAVHHLFYNSDTQRELLVWLYAQSNLCPAGLLNTKADRSVWHHLCSLSRSLSVRIDAFQPNYVSFARVLELVELLLTERNVYDAATGMGIFQLTPSTEEVGGSPQLRAENESKRRRLHLRKTFQKFCTICSAALRFWTAHRRCFALVLKGDGGSTNDDGGSDDSDSDDEENSSLVNSVPLRAAGMPAFNLLQMQPQEIKRLGETFQQYSGTRGDRLDRVGVAKLIQLFGLDQAAAEAISNRFVFVYSNKRHPDSVSFQDVMEALHILCNGKFEEQADLLFTLAGSDADGKVCLDDAKQLLKEVRESSRSRSQSDPLQSVAIDVSEDALHSDMECLLDMIFLAAVRKDEVAARRRHGRDGALAAAIGLKEDVNALRSHRLSLKQVLDAHKQVKYCASFLQAMEQVVGDHLQNEEHQEPVPDAHRLATPGASADPSRPVTPSIGGHEDVPDHSQGTLSTASLGTPDEKEDSSSVSDRQSDDDDDDEDEEENEPPTPSLDPAPNSVAPMWPAGTSARRSSKRKHARSEKLNRTSSLRAKGDTAGNFRWTWSNMLLFAVIVGLEVGSFFCSIMPSALGAPLEQDWNVGQTMIGVFASSVTMGYMCSLFFIPALAKKYGARSLSLILFWLNVAAVVAANFAAMQQSILWLTAGQFLLGLGDFYLLVGLLIAQHFPASQFGLLYGICNSVYMATMLLGTLIIPSVYASNGLPLAIYAFQGGPILSLCCVIVYSCVLHGNAPQQVQSVGALSNGNAVLQMGMRGLSLLRTMSGLPARAGESLLGSFSAKRKKTKSSTMSFGAWSACAHGIVVGGAVYSNFWFTPIFLSSERGWDSAQAVLAITSMATFTGIFLTPLLGHLFDTRGRRVSISMFIVATQAFFTALLFMTTSIFVPYALGISSGVLFSNMRSYGVPSLRILVSANRFSAVSAFYFVVLSVSIIIHSVAGGVMISAVGFGAFAAVLFLEYAILVGILAETWRRDTAQGGQLQRPQPKVSLRGLPHIRRRLSKTTLTHSKTGTDFCAVQVQAATLMSPEPFSLHAVASTYAQDQDQDQEHASTA